MKKETKIYLSGVLSVWFLGLSGCGVKGDPLPPDQPAEIGNGKPVYDRNSRRQRWHKKDPADREGNEDGEESNDKN